MSDAPIWQTYRAHEGMSPKQSALIDALLSLSWSTPGCSDTMSTIELADAVGCCVESAWHALESMDWPEMHTPAGLNPWADVPADRRCDAYWTVPEDNEADDDEWYGQRIEDSRKLGREDAVAHWKAEHETTLPEHDQAELRRCREVDRVAAEHAARQTVMFESEDG